MNENLTSFEERIERRWSNSKPAWRRVDLGAVDSVPLGEGRSFTIDGLLIAVFRQRDGQLFATDGACPHRNGPLADGIVGGGKVICPFHAWKFDLATGHCVSGDAAQLRAYPIHVVNGRLVVELREETKA
jgi:nitrite reductase (NADH) small subunit